MADRGDVASLDLAIKEYFADVFGPEAAYVTHWTIVAAGVDLDNQPRIMGENSHEDMPSWQVRGLLEEGLISLRSEE